MTATGDGVSWAQTNTQLVRNLRARGWSDDDLARVRRAHVFSGLVTGGLLRHTGRSVHAHLAGVADVLASLDHDPTLLEAAFLHTAFGRGAHRGMLSVQRRYNRRLVEREYGPSMASLLERFAVLNVGGLPRVNGGTWVDPDVAVLQLANVVEELDTSAEFLTPHHRKDLMEQALEGARLAREAGSQRLADLLEASAANGAAISTSEPPWVDMRIGQPLRVSVGWFPPGARWFAVMLPRRLVRLVNLSWLRTRLSADRS